MDRQCLLTALFALLALAHPASAAIEDCEGDLTPSNPDNPIVELATPIGSICIELLADQAPLTVGNFMTYMEQDAWEDTFFQRSVPGFVIQAGGYKAGDDGVFERVAKNAEVLNEACTLDTEFDPIDWPGLEICSERGNEQGTLSMAKVGDPVCGQTPGACVPRPSAEEFPRPQYVNSATSEWFINLVDNRSNLDNQNGGFTVFANVLGDGLDIAQDIGQAPWYPTSKLAYSVDANPQTLVYAFTSLPLQADVEDPLPSYGCFDVGEVTAVLASVADPTNIQLQADWDFDPELDRILVASGNCGTFLADRADFVASPSENPSCPTVDQIGVKVLDDATLSLTPTPNIATAPAYQYTCDDLADSAAGIAQRRADISPLIAAQLMRIEVPEPSASLLARLSVGIIAVLAARAARGRRA